MRVIIDNKMIHGVPLIEVYTEKDEAVTSKKLMFFCHGFNSRKENRYDLVIEMAKLGFYVVTIDATKHGERIEEPFITGGRLERQQEIFDITMTTGRDIINLFEKHYSRDFDSFSCSGISMGGAVTYYVGSKCEKVDAIIPIIASPSFVEFAKYKIKEFGLGEEDFTDNWDTLALEEPISHMKGFDNMKVLVLTGTQDTTVPDIWSKQFVELLVENGFNKQVKFLEYDVDHRVTEKMKKDILSWAVDNLL